MSKQAEFAVILKMNPMFADLGADELQRIFGLCKTQQLGAGEKLFRKGDSGDALYGVRRGQIRIETGTSDGSRLTLNFLGPSELKASIANCSTGKDGILDLQRGRILLLNMGRLTAVARDEIRHPQQISINE